MAFTADTADTFASARDDAAAERRTDASFFEIFRAARRLSIAATNQEELPQDAIDVVMGKRAFLRS